MIIAKAPYRISFFGGGSDYPEWYEKNGGAFLSASLDHYIFIFVRKVPAFKLRRFRILWRIFEEETDINKIRNPIVRECLKMLNIDFSLDIGYFGDLPSNSGMGSSSTFTVALLGALYQLLGEKKTKFDLVKDAIKIEREILKETVGIQDQINASYGGFNHVEIKNNGEFVIQKVKISPKQMINFTDRLLLVYTGISRHASKIAEVQVNNFSVKFKNIANLQEMACNAKKILEKNENIDDFGLLLNEGWMHKKDLANNVSNETIDKLYDLGIKNGALGGKLLGAGGGGFILFFAKNGRMQNLKDSLNKYSFLPVKLADSGLEIKIEGNLEYSDFHRDLWDK